jgi:hypothetical protein
LEDTQELPRMMQEIARKCRNDPRLEIFDARPTRKCRKNKRHSRTLTELSRQIQDITNFKKDIASKCQTNPRNYKTYLIPMEF